MGAITDAFRSAFRAFVTDGVPASGANEPSKTEIQGIGPTIEEALATINQAQNIAVSYATRAALYADLAHAANSLGLVYNDSDHAKSGYYVKVGSSGSGSWS